MRAFAQFISYISHPLLMPALGLVLLFELNTLPVTFNVYDALYYYPSEIKWTFYKVFGVLLFIAPLLSIVIMRVNKMIPSLEMPERKHRIYPLAISTFYFLMSYYAIRLQLGDPYGHPALFGYFFGMIIVFVLVFAINYFWLKISLHAVGIFALIGALLGYSQTQMSGFDSNQVAPNLNIILLLIVFAGLVGFSRLYLKAHTLREVLVGSIVGFLVMFFCVKFGWYV